MHIAISFHLGHKARDPDPQRGGEHKHKDAEGQGGGTCAHILLVTASDDNTREGGRKSTGKHHHLQLDGIHLEDKTYDEQHGRHQEEFEAGIVLGIILMIMAFVVQSLADFIRKEASEDENY